MNINTKQVRSMYEKPAVSGRVLGSNNIPKTQQSGPFGNINRLKNSTKKAMPVNAGKFGQSKDAIINAFKNLYRVPSLTK